MSTSSVWDCVSLCSVHPRPSAPRMYRTRLRAFAQVHEMLAGDLSTLLRSRVVRSIPFVSVRKATATVETSAAIER
jgi:hypothetical protein